MSKLSHYDSAGQARMVDVTAKAITPRSARAHAFVKISRRVLDELKTNPKGDPLEVARIAGQSNPAPQLYPAVFQSELRLKSGLTLFLPGSLRDGSVLPTNYSGSGDIYLPGEEIQVLPLT